MRTYTNACNCIEWADKQQSVTIEASQNVVQRLSFAVHIVEWPGKETARKWLWALRLLAGGNQLAAHGGARGFVAEVDGLDPLSEIESLAFI